MHFDRPKKGDYLETKHFTQLYDAIDAGPTVVPPLYVTGGGAIALGEQPGIWIKITGAPSGTAHPWVQVFAATGGTWTTGDLTGTTSDDPAYELNALATSISGKFVRAWRDTTSYEMRFAYSACS